MKLAVIVLLSAAALPAQVAAPANQEYQTKQGRERVAERLGAPERDAWQKPQQLLETIGLKTGMTVADLGTGPGYFLPYLSRAVGPEGRVIAEDIQRDLIDKARARVEKEKLSNVGYVVGTEKDARLPESFFDVVLAVDAYHHFDYPAEMLAGIRKSLKQDGRFVVVDYYKSHFRDARHVRLDAAEVVAEVEANGFRLTLRRDHVPNEQYVEVFVRK